MVIWNHNGEVIASLTQPLSLMVPTQAIEAQAIIQEFALATQIGLSEFIVELDCLDVVQRVNKKHQDRPLIGHLVIQIRNSLLSLPQN